jgi:hypothetical protein
VTDAEAQGIGGLPVDDALGGERPQDSGPRGLFLTHGDQVHEGMTSQGNG